MQGVAGAYHKLIVYSWVPILQVGGLGKVRVNCFPKVITTWLGWESNPRSPDPESDALTTLPRCPLIRHRISIERLSKNEHSSINIELFPHLPCHGLQHGTMVCQREHCPSLNCSPSDQVLPPGACCPVCQNQEACEAEGREIKVTMLVKSSHQLSSDAPRCRFPLKLLSQSGV